MPVSDRSPPTRETTQDKAPLVVLVGTPSQRTRSFTVRQFLPVSFSARARTRSGSIASLTAGCAMRSIALLCAFGLASHQWKTLRQRARMSPLPGARTSCADGVGHAADGRGMCG